MEPVSLLLRVRMPLCKPILRYAVLHLIGAGGLGIVIIGWGKMLWVQCRAGGPFGKDETSSHRYPVGYLGSSFFYRSFL